MSECKDCIHYDVCKIAEFPVCWKKDEGFRFFKPKSEVFDLKNEREVKIIEACRHVGDTVYSALFNVPGEPPQLCCETIHYIEVGHDRIDLYGDCECFIIEFDMVGKWNNDLFSSFSQSDVEEEIEKWWKKELDLD